MSILSTFHIEPAFHALWRWIYSYWRVHGPTRLSEQPPNQSLLSYYALRPNDLPELLGEAWAMEAVRPIESLISLLERRLDNVVFRMGFAGSIPEARRLIARGHILVNRYPPKSTHMNLWPGDVIHFTLSPYNQLSISNHLRPKQLPSYLQYLNPYTTDRGMMLSLPNLGNSPFPAVHRNASEGKSPRLSFGEALQGFPDRQQSKGLRLTEYRMSRPLEAKEDLFSSEQA
jgi:small subunit ribosomal protein S4